MEVGLLDRGRALVGEPAAYVGAAMLTECLHLVARLPSDRAAAGRYVKLMRGRR